MFKKKARFARATQYKLCLHSRAPEGSRGQRLHTENKCARAATVGRIKIGPAHNPLGSKSLVGLKKLNRPVCVFSGQSGTVGAGDSSFLPRRLGLAVSAQRAGATGTACVRGEPQKSERKPSEGLEAAGEASLSAHASPAFQNAALSAALSDLDLQSRNVVVVVTSTAYRQAVAVKTPPLKC